MKARTVVSVLVLSFFLAAFLPALLPPAPLESGTALAAKQETALWSGRSAFPFLKPGEKRKNPPQPREAEGFVRHLYRGFLGRDPRGGEAASWRDRLARGDDRAYVVRDFMNSDEVFVRQLYLGLLGREPDPEGIDYFTEALRSGRSRQDVIDAIVGSQEFNSKVR